MKQKNSLVSELAAKERERLQQQQPNPGTPPTEGLSELPTFDRPWPELHPAAYYGLAGEIIRTLDPETESDPVGLLVTLLVYLGNAIGRGPHFVVEGTNHHGNLFAVMVGESSRGRKGTGEGRIRRLFEAVEPVWWQERIQAGLSTGEGLIFAVRNPVGEADPGVEDKRLLIVESEFAQPLSTSKRENNTLSSTLRNAWESGILRTLTRKEPLTSKGAHISIVGHITRDELAAKLTNTDVFNGFGNRFLWVCVRRSKILPYGGNDLDLSHLVEALKLVIQTGPAIGRMRRTAAANELWDKLYRILAEQDRRGTFGAMTARAEPQILRLSMLYALCDRSEMIATQHLLAALAVWLYCDASAERLFGESVCTLSDRIVLEIQREPGITRSELHDCIDRHLTASRFQQALSELEIKQRIRSESIPTKGRPQERWYPADSSPGGLNPLFHLFPQAEEVEIVQPPAGIDPFNNVWDQIDSNTEQGTF